LLAFLCEVLKEMKGKNGVTDIVTARFYSP